MRANSVQIQFILIIRTFNYPNFPLSEHIFLVPGSSDNRVCTLHCALGSLLELYPRQPPRDKNPDGVLFEGWTLC